MRNCIRGTLLLASLAVSSGAQNVPVTRLTGPIAEFPEGYTSLTDLRELPDGRVLVLERCERVVKALDLDSGTERQVGRSGAGPGEYRLPGASSRSPATAPRSMTQGTSGIWSTTPTARPAACSPRSPA